MRRGGKALMLQRNTPINHITVNRHSKVEDSVLRPGAAPESGRREAVEDRLGDCCRDGLEYNTLFKLP